MWDVYALLVCVGVTIWAKYPSLNFTGFLLLFLHLLGCFRRLRRHKLPQTHPPKDAQEALLGLQAALSSAQGNANLSVFLGMTGALPVLPVLIPSWAVAGMPSSTHRADSSASSQLWGCSAFPALCKAAALDPKLERKSWFLSCRDLRRSDFASHAEESTSQGCSALPPPAQNAFQRNQSSTIAFAQWIKGAAPSAGPSAPRAWQDLSLHPWAPVTKTGSKSGKASTRTHRMGFGGALRLWQPRRETGDPLHSLLGWKNTSPIPLGALAAAAVTCPMVSIHSSAKTHFNWGQTTWQMTSL